MNTGRCYGAVVETVLFIFAWAGLTKFMSMLSELIELPMPVAVAAVASFIVLAFTVVVVTLTVDGDIDEDD